MTTYKLSKPELLLKNMMLLEEHAKPHYPSTSKMAVTGGLKELNSVWLARDCNPVAGTPLPKFRRDEISFLAEAASLLNKTVDDIHYAYYAILPPDSQIYPHCDTAPYYQSVNRYQVFFNLSEDNIVIQEGNLTESNSVVWFDASKLHAFKNLSKTDSWRFIVFDIYKD